MSVEFQLVLVHPGINRAAVILRVRQLLKLSIAEARSRVDEGEVVLNVGWYNNCYLRDLQCEFEELGATVKLI